MRRRLPGDDLEPGADASRARRRPRVQVLSYSVTPERDSARALRAFAKTHGITDPRWHLLTGASCRHRAVGAGLLLRAHWRRRCVRREAHCAHGERGPGGRSRAVARRLRGNPRARDAAVTRGRGRIGSGELFNVAKLDRETFEHVARRRLPSISSLAHRFRIDRILSSLRLGPVDGWRNVFVGELEARRRALDDSRTKLVRQRKAKVELRAPADSLFACRVARLRPNARRMHARVHAFVENRRGDWCGGDIGSPQERPARSYTRVDPGRTLPGTDSA